LHACFLALRAEEWVLLGETGEELEPGLFGRVLRWVRRDIELIVSGELPGLVEAAQGVAGGVEAEVTDLAEAVGKDV
jgi:hypothetical protein